MKGMAVAARVRLPVLNPPCARRGAGLPGDVRGGGGGAPHPGQDPGGPAQLGARGRRSRLGPEGRQEGRQEHPRRQEALVTHPAAGGSAGAGRCGSRGETQGFDGFAGGQATLEIPPDKAATKAHPCRNAS